MTLYITSNKAEMPLYREISRRLGEHLGHTAIQIAQNLDPDFAFYGVGPQWMPWRICGDVKRLTDMLWCIRDKHHLEQIRRARGEGYNYVVLILQVWSLEDMDGMVGSWSQSAGKIVQAAQNITTARLDQYLLQLQMYAGVPVIRTRTVAETARVLWQLYTMFQKPPEEHSSLRGFYADIAVPGDPEIELVDGLGEKPSLIRRVANQLDGVGWTRSEAIERYVRSKREGLGLDPDAATVQDLVEMGVEEWREVEGVGKGIAGRIMKQMHRDV